MDDGELLRRIAAKDLGAFKILVDRFQNKVLGLCSRLLSHPQNAEDVAQDVFFQVYKSAGTFRHDCRVSTWIYRIAVNRCRNFNRDNRKFAPGGGLLQPGQPLPGILILGNARVGALGPFLYSLFLNLSSKSMRFSFIRA